MLRRGVWRRSCAEALLIWALVLPGCGRVTEARLQQDMRMGQFTLRASAVNVYSRSHQGVPLEVEVLFVLEGGNRFERQDFTETVSRNGRVIFTTAQGWRDRCWFMGEGEDKRILRMTANPPLGSDG